MTQTNTVTCQRCWSLACNCGDQPFTFVASAPYTPPGNRQMRRAAWARARKARFIPLVSDRTVRL